MSSGYFFNWSSLGQKLYLADMDSEVTAQIDYLLSEHGSVPLEELFLYRERGGQRIIQELDNRQNNEEFIPEQRGQFKIRVLINKDGSTPKPGDVFSWVHTMKATFVDASGKRRPMNTAEQERLRRRCRKPGDANDWRIWRNYKLDEDCCFRCGFHDAMACITNMTEHSLYPPTGKKTDGSPIHYWLVEQADFGDKVPPERDEETDNE